MIRVVTEGLDEKYSKVRESVVKGLELKLID